MLLPPLLIVTHVDLPILAVVLGTLLANLVVAVRNLGALRALHVLGLAFGAAILVLSLISATVNFLQRGVWSVNLVIEHEVAPIEVPLLGIAATSCIAAAVDVYLRTARRELRR